MREEEGKEGGREGGRKEGGRREEGVREGGGREGGGRGAQQCPTSLGDSQVDSKYRSQEGTSYDSPVQK